MSRSPTPEELVALLRDHADLLHERLGLGTAHFRIPTDGRGLRVQVSVRPGERSRLPRSVVLDLEAETLQIPLEIVEDYEDFEPL